MNAAELCRQVLDTGMTINADGTALVIRPGERLTPCLRNLLVEHKPELLDYLHKVEAMSAELMFRAMAVCDSRGDGSQARAEMRTDIESTPVHLRADLLAHFRSVDSAGGCPCSRAPGKAK